MNFAIQWQGLDEADPVDDSTLGLASPPSPAMEQPQAITAAPTPAPMAKPASDTAPRGSQNKNRSPEKARTGTPPTYLSRLDSKPATAAAATTHQIMKPAATAKVTCGTHEVPRQGQSKAY